MYFSCILLTNFDSGHFFCVCEDLNACCSISDFFSGFVARQLDESRSVYSKYKCFNDIFPISAGTRATIILLYSDHFTPSISYYIVKICINISGYDI